MTTDDSSVFLEITFNSSLENIWKAWTNPGIIINWFGSDHNGKGLKAVLDVRLGRFFEIIFQESDLTEHTCSGIYDEAQVLNKLVEK